MLNNLKTFVLFVVMGAIIMAAGTYFGGQSGLAIGLGIALIFTFGSYWYSDKIATSMYGAREVSPQEAPALHEMVERLSRAAGIPKPRIAIVDLDIPNAFATGRDPSHGLVAVTTGLLNGLSQDEIEGVVAHELAHIKHRDTLTMAVAAAMAMAITFIARMAFWFGGSRDNGGGLLGMLAMLIVAPLAATLIQLAISRSREFEADAGAAKITGNPRGLAYALARLEGYNKRAEFPYADPATAHMFIVQPAMGGSLVSLFSTHPSTKERIKRLEAMAR
ncbi:MAG: zinc metalloprotease HtpX [bacterium]